MFSASHTRIPLRQRTLQHSRATNHCHEITSSDALKFVVPSTWSGPATRQLLQMLRVTVRRRYSQYRDS
jgi:hypothetical protein